MCTCALGSAPALAVRVRLERGSKTLGLVGLRLSADALMNRQMNVSSSMPCHTCTCGGVEVAPECIRVTKDVPQAEFACNP